jgi:hypothetical protein
MLLVKQRRRQIACIVPYPWIVRAQFAPIDIKNFAKSILRIRVFALISGNNCRVLKSIYVELILLAKYSFRDVQNVAIQLLRLRVVALVLRDQRQL